MTTVEKIMADAEALAGPITADAPAGRSPTGEERYLELRMEVETETVPSADPVDWGKAAQLGSQVLREVSKDLFALVYTTHALYKTRGIRGLATGVAALDLCLTRYWDRMFPPVARLKGRIMPLTWFVEHVCPGLKTAEPSRMERGVVEVVHLALVRIRGFCKEKLAAQAPDFDELIGVVEGLVKSAPEKLAGEGDVGEPVSVMDPAEAKPAAVATPGPTASGSTQAEPTLLRAREMVALWLVPIAGPSRGGADPLATREFGLLQREVDKLQGLSPGSVDWARIIELASGILTHDAKDLRVACYLAFALYRKNGLDGLARGLALVAELLDDYWADLHPSLIRLRTRVAPVAWLLEYLEAPLLAHRPASEELPAIDVLDTVLRRFTDIVRGRFGDQAPQLRPVTEAIAQFRMSVVVPPVTPPVVKTEAPRVAPSSTPGPKEPPRPSTQGPSSGAKPKLDLGAPEVSTASGVEKYLKAVGEQMTKAAAEIRGLRSVDPLAYRLLRIGGWLHIHGPIKVGPDGSLGVMGVPEPERQALQAAYSDKKWDDVVARCEKLFVSNRFVLDLHRMTVEALRGLGSDHEPAALGVIVELRNFLNRVPELITATDGRRRPFADDMTRGWIETEVLIRSTPSEPRANGPVVPVVPGVPGVPLRQEENDDQVLTALRAAGKGDALAAALAWVQGSSTPRVRFSRRLSLAELCAGLGDLRLATMLYLGLAQDVKDYRLDAWDPPLAARSLEGLVRAIAGVRPLAQGVEERRIAEDTLGQLTRLDPVKAAELAAEIFAGKLRP